MLEKIKKNKDFLLYIVLIVSVFGVFSIAKAGMVGDDLWFREKALSIPFFDYIKERYLLWSSRVLIEALEYFLVKHVMLWKILTSIVYAGGMLLASRLTESIFHKKLPFMVHALFVFSLYAFRKEMFYGAGWISTTVNYIWPIAALILCIFYMNKLCEKKKLAAPEYIICTVSLMYCVCQEISCPVALVFIVLFTILYYKKNNKFNAFFFILLLIDAAGFLNAFLCPGNKLRMAQETATWFPGFENLTLFTKIELGFSSTMQNFNTRLDPFGLMFFALVFLAAVVCINNALGKLIGAVPVIINIIFVIFKFDNLKKPPFEFDAADPFVSTGTNPSFSNPGSLTVDILFLVQILCIIIVVAIVMQKDKAILWTVLLVLGTGFMSRIAMGFSPTVWVSGIRTFSMLYISMAFVLLALGYYLYKKNKYTLFFGLPFVIYGIVMNVR